MSPADDAGQYPGAATGPGVLTSRLIDIPQQLFAEEHWGRKALLTHRAGDFADLFSPAAVDELISRRGLRSPFLRVAKDGETLPVSSFTSPGGVGATIGDQLDDTALWRHLDAGATLVLQALQRTWEPIGDFVTRLAEELGHPVQANAYITPPQNQGFDDHYDVHDVFVLQISGTKRWIIHEPVVDHPLRDQPWTDRRDEVAAAATDAPAIDAVLEPGDVLYLPRGWLHAATAQGEVSIHLTLGVHTWTGHAVAEQLAQAVTTILRDDPEIRASLPLGVEELDQDIVDLVKKRFADALDQADPRPAFHRTRRSQARPAPLGPLAQLRAVNDLGPDTLVSWRGGLDSTVTGSRLMTRVGWLDLTDEELTAVRRLLDGEVLTCGELGTHLTRRLLRAGVVVPVQS
ncbi:cupin-like domain-containing protein [Aeromicrobium sp. YIM 150415]|uniref:cupin domain-containing protein n=1 Tax=Aeromicrobium sp. YIM 150415 TaxID=2803912 RepID=UPI0019654295|nr:cupin domain-containing protein [Aeromicrobium sp. YIM 150415]MBM9465150.1 cupin-like domain-containing protein [Aeromicrobium sp. YIM 150415]